MTKSLQAYGTWQSPLSPKRIAGALRLNEVLYDTDGTLIWHEKRAGLGILVKQTGVEALCDLTDASLNVAGRVGYGGGDFGVGAGQVIFSANGRLWRMPTQSGLPQAITPKFGDYASPNLSPDGRYVVYVHSYEEHDSLCIVDSAGHELPRKLVQGDDFYMQWAWHPQGQTAAYIAWNHPNMPWNQTELRLVTLINDGIGLPRIGETHTLIQQPDVAIQQPLYSPDGRYLSYISDVDGWTHLYLYDLHTGQTQQITQGEFEVGTPAWVQNLRTYGWTHDSSALVYIRNHHAHSSLWHYTLASAEHQPIPSPDYSYFKQISLAPHAAKLAVIASSAQRPARLLELELTGMSRIIRRSTSERLSTEHFAPAHAIHWLGHDSETVHGLYYPPTHPQFEGMGLPPLVVLVHGGPTSQRWMSYEDEVQFFATRGYAVLQVNHRGSTGYGKAYMNKHHLNWGIYDVEDCVTGAQYLVKQGLADPQRLVIMGGSAGGFSVLMALIQHPNFFKAGVNNYGVVNQFGLVIDTHKFEARYSDWLLGVLPEAAERYRQRSPIFHAQRIQDALIVFQGLEDTVVPKAQSDEIVAALRRRGVPHEYHLYEGEGHGWSKPQTIEDYYSKLERFLLVNVIYA